jgi:hypothetical protein
MTSRQVEIESGSGMGILFGESKRMGVLECCRVYGKLTYISRVLFRLAR